MPPGPNDFGMKRVTLSKDNRMRTREIYVFYSPLFSTHPMMEGDQVEDGAAPNWFYYWRKTSAGGTVYHYGVLTETGETR